MANKLYEESHIQLIADGIRRKNSLSDTMYLREMPFGISEADTSPYGKMPGYWKNSVDNAIATIKGLVQNDSDYIPLFAYFSDTHIRYKYSPNSGYTGTLSAMVMNATEMPFAVCTGDIAASSGNGFTKESEMVDCFEDANDNFSPIGWHRLLVTQGNHDGSWGTANGKAYAYQMSPEKLYKYIYKKLDTSNHIFGGGDNSYYYADYEEKKIRIIMLNSLWCETSENADGTAVYDRMHFFGFGQAQLSWLADTALAFDEEGWTVILATHVPPIAAQSSYYRDMNILHGILSAYCNKTSYSGSYTYNAGKNEGTWANVSISVNYTNAITGKIIGFFCGHLHKDTIDTSTYDFPIITITSDSDLSYDDEEEDRVEGTDNENAIDFVTVNLDKQEVVLTRVGVGSSRVYSYKDTVLYSITNSLTNVSTSNGAASIEEGQPYSATLSVADNFEFDSVTVTMGGVDITSSAYSNGVITIAKVTGNIVITAVATEVASYTNLAVITNTDSRLNSSGNVVSYSGGAVTDWIDCVQGDVIRIKGLNILHTSCGYAQIYTSQNDASSKPSSYSSHFTTDDDGVITFTVATWISSSTQPSITKMRFSGEVAGTAADVIITKNEVIT